VVRLGVSLYRLSRAVRRRDRTELRTGDARRDQEAPRAEVLKWLAITTVIAGWALWVRNALLYPSIGEWVTSSFGIVLTIGGIAATAAAYFGITGIGNNVEKLVSIGDEVGASGSPPTPEQGAEMARLGAEIQRHSKIDIVLLFIAVIAMATARYW
jgi:hypothetical protein